jgi:signal transduction histidine kinase
MHMSELLGEKVFQLNKPHVQQALSGHRQRFERRLVRVDGSHSIADANYLPDIDAAGVVRGFFVLVTDITSLHESYARNRELIQRLETVREEERREIARNLHEGIAQDLFAIKLGLDRQRREAAGRSGAADALTELAAVVEKCMSDVQHIADGLRPTALMQLPVSEAIRQHGGYFAVISGLRINVTQVEPFPGLDETTQLLLFRAAQEALTNIARHARASSVDIFLSADPDFVQLEVLDNGVGIHGDARSRPGSLGLLGIQERFGAMGGGLVVARRDPCGTRFAVRLPR